MPSPVCGHTLNLDNLHFTPDELRSLNELVVTAVLEAPELSLFHTLVTGIKNDRRIGIIPGTFGLIGKAAQSCNPTAQCYENTAIEKTWEPRYLELIIDMCIDELGDTLQKLATKCGVEVFDLTKTEIFSFILDILSKDIPKMLLRNAWFGDKTAANVSGGGVITDGVDVDFFNVINGFWYQIAEIYAADATKRTAFIGNNQATTALQKSVATPILAYANLNLVIDEAIPELAAQPDRVLLVTQSVSQRVRRHLQTLGTPYEIKLMLGGLETSIWDGIKMISIPLWDQWIAAYENNGTKLNNPHRVVYTTISNLNIGMTCTSLFDNINTFYDPRSRINRIEAVDAFDAKIIDDRLIQVGL